MKKIIVFLLLMCGTFSFSIAQTTTKASVTKQDKAAIAAQKKADKEAKAEAKKQAKEAKAMAKKQAEEAKTSAPASNNNAAHLNKNGTPDKRFKANKQPKATTQAPPEITKATPATSQTSPATSKRASKSIASARGSKVKTPDPVIGKDAKGRTLYQGPRGGKYYLTANGNKEYEK